MFPSFPILPNLQSLQEWFEKGGLSLKALETMYSNLIPKMKYPKVQSADAVSRSRMCQSTRSISKVRGKCFRLVFFFIFLRVAVNSHDRLSPCNMYLYSLCHVELTSCPLAIPDVNASITISTLCQCFNAILGK